MYGYLQKPHAPEHKVFGSVNAIGGTPVEPNGQWAQYVPPTDAQQNAGFSDPEDCTSYGTLACIETLASVMFNDATEYSKRFLAWSSGTTLQGNDPWTVATALASKGTVPESVWPESAAFTTWEEYYDLPPSAVVTEALEFPAHYELDKEWVTTDAASLMQALQFSPLGVAGYAWATNPTTGLYYTPSGAEPCHWFALVGYVEGQYWIAFDSYQNDIKHIQWDYIFNEALRYSLTNNVVSPTAWEQFVAWLMKAIGFAPAPQNAPVAASSDPNSVTYPWDTPEHCYHDVRVICDQQGLTLAEKNLICACLFQESRFSNAATHQNILNGKVVSTDWGIAQINDYYHIGAGKDFPSVQYVLDNPDKVIEWMVGMYQHGLLKQWVSYSSGAYLEWIKPDSPMWALSTEPPSAPAQRGTMGA